MTDASAERRSSSRFSAPAANRGFAAELVALILLGLFWTLWLRPAPFSDFLLYWNEAGAAVAYERGGAGVLMFALVRRFLSAPQWAALCVNLPAAAFLLWLFWCCDTTRWRVFAHLGALYLLLITPYFGLVQIETTNPHAGSGRCGRRQRPPRIAGCI